MFLLCLIFFRDRVVVELPFKFNFSTMRNFIAGAVEAQRESGAREIYFDFSTLGFVRPEGIVVLSNTIEHFKQANVKVFFRAAI